ncbi:conserved hypothetical protein [Planktothrix serta PCC 8927]|uniref:DUF3727 domain-containing protein n=2 Tax=Planktothrix TaxID=54304 RepID=A0A7Z9BRH3_9CYAN|nr:conserved hypothetical protein [Planktothrix serta PCC 8927]
MMFPSKFPQDNGRSEEEHVTLTDEQGRSLICTLQSSIQLEGQDYGLLLPVDTPIEILTWNDEDDDDESAVPVESEAELERIFETARAVLAEQNLTLKRTGITLTVSGDLPDFPEEGEPNLDLNSSQPDPEEFEELLWLASFYYEEQEYGIYTPADPFFILAKADEQGEFKQLSPEEFRSLEPLLPMIEDQLFDALD